MTNLNFSDLLDSYIAKFGHTFTSFGIRPGKQEEKVKELMIQALEGKRGKITDKDLGIDLPEGALI